MIAGHRLHGKLRELAEREVWEGEVDGVRCATRILRGRRMAPAFARSLRTAVVDGRGSFASLGHDIAMTVEGYGVAARLMADPGDPPRWPRAVAAGLTEDGLPFVSTLWMEGAPLHELAAPLSPTAADHALLSLVDTLATLHGRLVAFGDLKLANLVLRSDGGLALIDLDTVREVPAADEGAPTRDRTANWAAPEQLEEGQTWLASDIWALRRLILKLFPAGAPEPWAILARACGARDPRRRPTAESCAAWLRGEGELVDVDGKPCLASARDGFEDTGDPASAEKAPVAAATERLPDAPVAPATERVEDAGPPVAPTRASAAALPPPPPRGPRRSGDGCLEALSSMGKVAAVVGAGFVFACCGGVAWWERALDDAADEDAAALSVELKAHKVDPQKNGATERKRLLAAAEELWRDRPTPRTCAVRALATIWGQGWQSEVAWSQTAYDAGSAAVNDPLCRNELEVALARSTLHAGACRRRFDASLSPSDCALAVAASGDFWGKVPAGEAHHWLRVEAAWQEVRALSATAGRDLELKNPEGAEAATSAIARCDEAEAWLPFAPVNGPELLDECLVVAGYSGNVDTYLRHADRRLARLPSADESAARRRVLTSLYQSAGLGCRDTRVTFSKRGGTLSAAGAPWCVALGHLARGCVEPAAVAAAEGALGDRTHPWLELTAAMPGRGKSCLQ